MGSFGSGGGGTDDDETQRKARVTRRSSLAF